MQTPSDIKDDTKSPTFQIYVLYKSTERIVRIFGDANISPIKTYNTVSRLNGVKGQEKWQQIAHNH